MKPLRRHIAFIVLAGAAAWKARAAEPAQPIENVPPLLTYTANAANLAAGWAGAIAISHPLPGGDSKGLLWSRSVYRMLDPRMYKASPWGRLQNLWGGRLRGYAIADPRSGMIDRHVIFALTDEGSLVEGSPAVVVSQKTPQEPPEMRRFSATRGDLRRMEAIQDAARRGTSGVEAGLRGLFTGSEPEETYAVDREQFERRSGEPELQELRDFERSAERLVIEGILGVQSVHAADRGIVVELWKSGQNLKENVLKAIPDHLRSSVVFEEVRKRERGGFGSDNDVLRAVLTKYYDRSERKFDFEIAERLDQGNMVQRKYRRVLSKFAQSHPPGVFDSSPLVYELNIIDKRDGENRKVYAAYFGQDPDEKPVSRFSAAAVLILRSDGRVLGRLFTDSNGVHFVPGGR